jgi:hypothetical protein
MMKKFPPQKDMCEFQKASFDAEELANIIAAESTLAACGTAATMAVLNLAMNCGAKSAVRRADKYLTAKFIWRFLGNRGWTEYADIHNLCRHLAALRENLCRVL